METTSGKIRAIKRIDTNWGPKVTLMLNENDWYSAFLNNKNITEETKEILRGVEQETTVEIKWIKKGNFKNIVSIKEAEMREPGEDREFEEEGPPQVSDKDGQIIRQNATSRANELIIAFPDLVPEEFRGDIELLARYVTLLAQVYEYYDKTGDTLTKSLK